MVAGIFHEGSGLGDQLFRYITVRTFAEDKGREWTMTNPSNFKGNSFIDLDVGPVQPWNWPVWYEKVVRDENGVDIRSFDPEINFVGDNTLIDGSFEDDKYWRHNLGNINKWLKVDELSIPGDVCIIGFRGGEYASQPDLFLSKDYYDDAIDKMCEIDPNMQFQVHTDDPILAQEYFPDFEIVDNKSISHSKHTAMGFNWRSARYAKYAIVPNSAFFIMPRILAHHERGHFDRYGHDSYSAVTIAPHYWARRNIKTWARPACYYPEFLYI